MKRRSIVISVVVFVLGLSIFAFLVFDPEKRRPPEQADGEEEEPFGGLRAGGGEGDAGVELNDDEDSTPGYRLGSTSRLPYGDGPGMIGLVADEGHEVAGAESFTVDGSGHFLVCDTINRRIQILDPETGETAVLPLPDEAVPADIVTNGETVMIFDYAGRLDQFDHEGNRLSSIDLDGSLWDIRLEMDLVGERILMRDVDQTDHLIGIIEEGVVREPTAEELGQHAGGAGARGPSGRTYRAELERWKGGRVEVAEPGGEAGPTLDVEAPGIVSLRFLGEDTDRNVFMQVERVEDERVFLEVHKFSGTGERVERIGIPENDYYFWTARLLSIDGNGNVYQALPQEQGMRFNVFTQH